MDPQVQALIEKNYPIVLSIEKREDGAELYAAHLLDMPGCAAPGETAAEAISRLETIMPAYFAKLLEWDVEIPEPAPHPAVLIGPVAFYDEATGGSLTRTTLEGEHFQQDLKLVAA